MQTDRHGVVYRSERDHIYIYIFVWFCDVTFWGISRRQQRRELKKNKNTLCWLRSDSDDYIKQYLMLIKNYYYHHLVIPRTILPICTASHPAFIVHDEHFPLEDVSLSLSTAQFTGPLLSHPRCHSPGWCDSHFMHVTVKVCLFATAVLSQIKMLVESREINNK